MVAGSGRLGFKKRWGRDEGWVVYGFKGGLGFSFSVFLVCGSELDRIEKWTERMDRTEKWWEGGSDWEMRVDRTKKFWGSDWERSYVDRTEKWKRETHRVWRGSAAWGRGSWAFGVREMVELSVWIGAWSSKLGAWSSSVCGLELGEHLLIRVRVRELRQKLFEVKMRTEMVFCLAPFILRSTLKIISVWPNFSDRPNSLFYGKAFLNLVWSQNKHSLSAKYAAGL